MKRIAVGISGFGLSGRYFHFPFLRANPRFQVKAVHTSRAEVVKELGQGISVCSDIEQLCREPLDLICLCVPNHLHFKYASLALRSGKHVLVEKPFTVTENEAAELVELAREKSRVLTVFQNRRFDSDFLTLQDILKNKTLGEIVEFEAHFDRFRPQSGNRWKEQPNPGSGLLYDLGSHLIDQTFQLFGTPRRILADLDVQRVGATEKDYFFLMLDYGRLKVRLRAGCLVAAPGPRYKVYGTTGTFLKTGMDPQEDQLRSGMSPVDPGFGIESSEHQGRFTSATDGKEILIESKKGNYMEFFDLLGDAIEGLSSPPVLAHEARLVIRAIELCQLSHEEGRWIHF